MNRTLAFAAVGAALVAGAAGGYFYASRPATTSTGSKRLSPRSTTITVRRPVGMTASLGTSTTLALAVPPASGTKSCVWCHRR